MSAATELPTPVTATSSRIINTPRRPLTTAAALSTPSAALLSSAAAIRSRQSLYGTHDRIVLDLGSRIWKVGFSSEATPRAGISVLAMMAGESKARGEECTIWELERSEMGPEEWELMEKRIQRGLRSVWFESLMADPKSRKVIIVDPPLMPTRIKAIIARILFNNLQVPAIIFTCSHMLALLAVGSVNGLVVDVGNLETTVLPIYHSRPLYLHLLTTPKAGARLTSRLRSLLSRFGRYIPPPTSLSSTTMSPARTIPDELLSEEMIEEIKTRICFVGERMPSDDQQTRETVEEVPMDEDYDEADDIALLNSMERRYSRQSTATTLSFPVPSLSLAPPTSGVGRGWIRIPGWIRERCAEVLFEEDAGVDERSVTEVILESLLQLPIDLRLPLASSILITGGTSMLPGFILRLRSELLYSLSKSSLSIPPDSPPLAISRVKLQSLAQKRLSIRLHHLRTAPHFSPLVSLIPHLRILNSVVSTTSPSTLSSSTSFAPALLSWIGGSLAGALRTGGEEITRERWEESEQTGSGARLIRDWSERRHEVAP